MTTIASEIERLQTAKADLKTAIEDKGVVVEPSATLDVYDDYVNDIQAGIAKVEDKGILFIDYDGTPLYSYTVEEIQELTELPALPQHEGLICQGWNWSLADIKTYNDMLVVGAVYITDDNKTRIYITLDEDFKTPTLNFFKWASDITIDWGDGSSEDVSGAGGYYAIEHAYATGGDYVITFATDFSTNNAAFYFGNSSSPVLTNGSSTAIAENINYLEAVRKVEIGKRVPYVGDHAFQSMYNLETITLPNDMQFVLCSATNTSSYALNNCYGLKSIVLPITQSGGGNHPLVQLALNGCYALSYISAPNQGIGVTTGDLSQLRGLKKITAQCAPYNGMTDMQSLEYAVVSTPVAGLFSNVYRLKSVNFKFGFTSSFSTQWSPFLSYAYSLKHIKFSGALKSIQGTFGSTLWYSIKTIDFLEATQVVTVTNASFATTVLNTLQILVPDNLYEDWVVATGWSNYPNNIIPCRNGEPMTKVTLTLAVDSAIESSTSLSKSQILTVATHTVTLPTMADITTTESGGEFYFSDGTTNYELGATITVSEPKTFTLYYNPYYTPSASDLASINDIIGLDPTDPATPDISETEVNAQLDEIIGGSAQYE